VARLAFLGVILGGLGKVENPLAAGLVVGLIQTVCTALLPFDYVYLVLYLLLAAILILRRNVLFGMTEIGIFGSDTAAYESFDVWT